jgi:integrating conjugative element protein (TIGR03746 family)
VSSFVLGRYRLAIDNVRFQNTLLWVLVAILVVFLGYALFALDRARQHLRPLYIPPDLRFGATVRLGEVPPHNVYAFGGYIFQQLNRWTENGEADYGRNIFRLQHFLTPKYRAALQADLALRAKRGELRDRARGVHEIAGHHFEAWRVEPKGAGRWVMWLDLAIQESVRGMPVKETDVRYPLEIVLADVDPEHNPWGLQLDGYAEEGPRRLKSEELHVNAESNPGGQKGPRQ